jgi:hypothetical protein
MLRSVPDAATVAALVARTCLAANPNGRIAPIETNVETISGPIAAFEKAHAA